MEKNSFFDNLNPKSALITGLVAGFLVVCSVGFFVMLFTGGSEEVKADKESEVAEQKTANVGTVPQAPKSDKPVVELFVMSHCPYGLQAEKAYLPVWKLLGNKADMSIKYVNYAMHGLKEIQEQNRQVCIAKEEGSEKLISYLECFTLADTPDKCLDQANINTNKIDSCVEDLDAEFGIMNAYNDKESWLSGRYPVYPVHNDLNNEYGVQGSPTLVINGEQIRVSRSPEAVKQAVCKAFNEAPEECDTVLSSAQASPSFGGGTASGTASAECGS